MIAYHDDEWGVPCHDDRALFERLCSKAFRPASPGRRSCASGTTSGAPSTRFDPQRIAAYDDADVARLLADPGIVRNRLKVRAAIDNARGHARRPPTNSARSTATSGASRPEPGARPSRLADVPASTPGVRRAVAATASSAASASSAARSATPSCRARGWWTTMSWGVFGRTRIAGDTSRRCRGRYCGDRGNLSRRVRLRPALKRPG